MFGFDLFGQMAARMKLMKELQEQRARFNALSHEEKRAQTAAQLAAAWEDWKPGQKWAPHLLINAESYRPLDLFPEITPVPATHFMLAALSDPTTHVMSPDGR